ncbi:fatty-acid--CoA ligase FadD1 [Mycobacteroides abscessus]|uniref:fatty-acid--CoA ligase FadD1 n=1 Tax=Mycobacteroides abscessus TaxID=36809 RepID=UPI00092667E1|nr:fatty-acid--CoA ligase FadD1 [Mycobacteroides abscessus]SHP24623.1 Possible fatty-acid-CoA ligase FadD [Mycobacteroides abscessus subsp. bolletii]SHR54831.1 Possible fatty-acid-CoA ligase FadD [Mycobacteroides abscessus subsp. bolletii]SHS29181.1 Possible fatty-acid-CoA ligase FadD [Mycobacteroides abscessus subsp. bolletii]SKF72823.1 Possible fatty-acid-CoA ligase FadD [Mycobacteroides abscessus subsp. bolletii]SKF88281.1 Possible fatty-acid-CoA ligase FadD [Mycobacteroides abscessus subsp
MADTIQQLVLARATDDSIGLIYRGQTWTWRAHLATAARHAAALIRIADPTRPLHVGTLLGNTPAMTTAMAAAAQGGYVLCAINNTRRGEGLLRDIRKSDVQVLLVDTEHRPLIDAVDLSDVTVIHVDSAEWLERMKTSGELHPYRTAGPLDPFMMIFTSGTSGDPKAVLVTHATVLAAAESLVDRFSLSAADVCYVSMPLFHSNAVLAGWAVAVAAGAALAPAKFSASRFLADIREVGATYMNYVGKPLAYVLATAEHEDDAANPLRVAFGNEASESDIAEFARRFDVTVYDGFGSTENAVIITREEGTPTGSVGKGFPGIAVYNPDTLRECAVARFDAHGILANPSDAVGELVNTQGAGFFSGYYNDDDATGERMRHGMYWSGDLAYRDADGWIYLAGRTPDWMRINGENLAAAPIERILQRHPAISQAAVYAIRDEHSGDALMAALVLRAPLTYLGLAEFLSAQQDLPHIGWPRYVRLSKNLPTTATNKILKRVLISEGLDIADETVWYRAERGAEYIDFDPVGHSPRLIAPRIGSIGVAAPPSEPTR